MHRLGLQKQKQQQAENADKGPKKKKVTAAQLRVQRGMSQASLSHTCPDNQALICSLYCPDLSELTLPSTMTMSFPNPDDIQNFTLTIEPDEGMYKGGTFNFTFAINQNFPHDPPKVKCSQKIYHPNIDLEGNVCLNILREDWKPVLNLNAVIVGLQVCFAFLSRLDDADVVCSFCSWSPMLRIRLTRRLLTTSVRTGKPSSGTCVPPWPEVQSREYSMRR